MDDDDFGMFVCFIGKEKLCLMPVLSEWKAIMVLGSSCISLYVLMFGSMFMEPLSYNFDLHYVNPSLSSGGESDVAFYVRSICLSLLPRLIRLAAGSSFES